MNIIDINNISVGDTVAIRGTVRSIDHDEGNVQVDTSPIAGSVYEGINSTRAHYKVKELTAHEPKPLAPGDTARHNNFSADVYIIAISDMYAWVRSCIPQDAPVEPGAVNPPYSVLLTELKRVS